MIKAKETEYGTFKIKIDTAKEIAGLMGMLLQFKPIQEYGYNLTVKDRALLKRHIGLLANLQKDMEF